MISALLATVLSGSLGTRMDGQTFQVDLHYGVPTVVVKDASKKDFKFVVDTGYPDTFFASKNQDAKSKTLQLGSMKFAARRQSDNEFQALTADGVLGADFFRSKAFAIDFNRKQMTVWPSGANAATASKFLGKKPKTYSLKETDDKTFAFKIHTGATNAELVIDTGASFCLLPKSSAPSNWNRVGTSTYLTTEGFERSPILLSQQVKLGSHSFHFILFRTDRGKEKYGAASPSFFGANKFIVDFKNRTGYYLDSSMPQSTLWALSSTIGAEVSLKSKRLVFNANSSSGPVEIAIHKIDSRDPYSLITQNQKYGELYAKLTKAIRHIKSGAELEVAIGGEVTQAPFTNLSETSRLPIVFQADGRVELGSTSVKQDSAFNLPNGWTAVPTDTKEVYGLVEVGETKLPAKYYEDPDGPTTFSPRGIKFIWSSFWPVYVPKGWIFQTPPGWTKKNDSAREGGTILIPPQA